MARWNFEKAVNPTRAKHVRFLLVRSSDGEVVDRCRTPHTENDIADTFAELLRHHPKGDYSYRIEAL